MQQGKMPTSEPADARAAAEPSAAAASHPSRSAATKVLWRKNQTHPRGRKKNPIWRVVVADQRSPRDGRFIETIGHYNPQTEPSTIVIDEERARHWLEQGAQPTDTVKKLLRSRASSPPSGGRRDGRDLLEYLARALVDQPDAGQGRVVRGGRRDARARAERRR